VPRKQKKITPVSAAKNPGQLLWKDGPKSPKYGGEEGGGKKNYNLWRNQSGTQSDAVLLIRKKETIPLHVQRGKKKEDFGRFRPNPKREAEEKRRGGGGPYNDRQSSRTFSEKNAPTEKGKRRKSCTGKRKREGRATVPALQHHPRLHLERSTRTVLGGKGGTWGSFALEK